MTGHSKTFAVLFVTCCSLLSSCKKNSDCTPATTSDAGPDQFVTTTTVTLAANSPASGKGLWSVVSGSGGSFSDVNSPTSTFTGAVNVTHVLRWTISGCPISQDDVQITINTCNDPTTANAGPDQNIGTTTTTLAANTPTSGSGTWSVVSGAGGNFLNPNSPTSTFTGVAGTTYVLRWTITACTSSSQDDVQIIFNTNPTATGVDKTSVINGEIITVSGSNFHVNYQGNSQLIARKAGTSDTYLPILSITSTQIKAVMTNPLTVGTFDLVYFRRETAAAGVEYPTSLQVMLVVPTASQFFIGSLASSTISKGSDMTIAVKNGSTTTSDYAVKIITYDYTTGTSQEITAPVVSITPNGFSGGTMDALSFTIPANTASGTYYCEVTYKSTPTLVSGLFTVN